MNELCCKCGNKLYTTTSCYITCWYCRTSYYFDYKKNIIQIKEQSDE